MVTVIHVTESLSSGVAVALEEIVRRADAHHHVVLGYRRKGVQTADALGDLAEVIELPHGKVRQYRQVRHLLHSRVTRSCDQPTVVHAHSSWGGLFVRLARKPGPVVYTPHGYAFTRSDVKRTTVKAFWLVEKLLGLRTDFVVANGPWEGTLARRLGLCVLGDRQIVPAACVGTGRQTPQDEASHWVVATAGRLSPQKDPQFFGEVARGVERLVPGSRMTFKWIGERDPNAGSSSPDQGGFEVSGWLERQAALGQIAGCDFYLQTSAWEAGVSLAALEAAALGRVVMVRAAPENRHWTGLRFDRPSEFAGAIVDATRSPDVRAAQANATARALATVQKAWLASDLNALYLQAAS